ncbi:HutD family protein [Rathayibacter sp. Leaf296]|uniref:HutD family protein n=1 Tax=Rathayibacter sp. Leaf296 TaxID=1736327 RepID=UPI000703015C|nr:HutD family protein [Rathayibacter sp. Leaf296]KQQ09852.1 hypothetical protein ASF46_01690 [Rathayibacter sp. Leaf296]
MTARLVRLGDLPSGRWPNGLGETRSVHANEGLKVGVARIHEAAPFSVLTGRDRLLTILGPEGILLRIDGQEHRLAPGDGIRFRGDAPVSVAATAAPTAVLNLIHDSGWSVEAACGRAENLSSALALLAAAQPADSRALAIAPGALALRLDVPGEDRVVLASWRRAHRADEPA